MIQFNIIGKGYLHLEKEGGLGFKNENQCFRFCDISLGRSSEFSAVDDEHNRTRLDLGGDPAMYGGMMRKRLPCQLQYDGGSIMGTLAVTGWSKGAFSCVFYMDDTEWLRMIQDTKMADLPVGSSYYTTWQAGIRPMDANTPSLPALSIVQYENPAISGGTAQFLPSMDVKEYLDLIAAYIGKPVTGINADEYRIVLGTANGAGEHSVTIGITGTTSATVTGGGSDFSVEDVTLEWARSNILGVYVGGGSTTVKGFKALRTLEITFPNTMPVDCYLVRWNSSLGQCVVMGGGSYDSLAGKTVKLTKNNIYVFVPNGWISVDTNGSFYGWKDIYYPLSVTCTVSAVGELSLGGVWCLQYNQPDMTIFEFLKSVALATGRELIIDPDGIELSAGNTGRDVFIDLKRIISIESVSRNVDAWGGNTGKSVVKFDSEDYVIDPITGEFVIDNEQLEGENEAESKFSEGTQGDYGVAIYDQTLDNGVGKVVAKRATITRIDANETYLQRVLPPDYPSCGDIADNSTCVVVKAVAPEMDFFGLKPYDYIVARGQLYRWMSAEWSEGVMTLNLQKVSQASQAIVPPPQLTGIVAVFTQGGATIYDTDSLDDLKQYLVVTANYDDNTSRVLNDNEYTLSGTLTVGTSTITVTYQGFTDTFTVVVTAALPYDAEIEYLESTGTQYIDTGISPHQNIALEIKWKNPTSQTGKYLFGSGTSTNDCIRAYISNSGTWRFGGASKSLTVTDTTERTATVNKNGLTVNGTTYSYTGTVGTFSSTVTIKVFAGATGQSPISTRIYYLKIWDNGTLVRDFIPVRVGSVGYMYDRVSGTLFGNDGTGDFILGPDV